MSQTAPSSLAEQARAALDRHEWRAAYDLLSGADAAGTLAAGELELLAEAAWWVGLLPVAIDARERAYAASMHAGDTVAATRIAIHLANDNLLRSSFPIASAWLSRADRLLAGVEENPAHGWVEVTRAFQAALVGDIDTGVESGRRAIEIGVRFGDRDLEMLGMSCQGVSLLARGDVAEALALMDEATVAAVGGELRPETAGGVCCATIEACTSIGDLRRAAEWTEAQDRWCAREGINGYPGMCRLFRAEIKRMRGSWLEAEAEARHASDELAGFLPAAVGVAWYTIGELRLRRGDLGAAEEALLKAHEHGREPEPALSLVRLAQGRVAEANASISRALDDPPAGGYLGAPPNSDLARSSLLPARVEIALAAGDRPAARAAAEELAAIAARFRTDTISARSASSLGAVQLAEDEAAPAVASYREAVRLWRDVGAPFDLAAARLGLARAHEAAGNPDRAVLEAKAAREGFERLGATLDVRRVDELLARLGDAVPDSPRSSRQRVTRTFVFTDIVDSTRLAELIGDESWDGLIRWHDETLRRLLAEHGGEEVKAVGDGLFVAFGEADRAVDFAIAVQRRFAEHRGTHGFAPAVRIGIHRAEASRAGLDYIGTGVNVAARIGAEASGGEVLASASTLASGRRAISEAGRRTVTLKGIRNPVEVISVDWR